MRRLLPLAAALALAGTLVHAPMAWACSCVANATVESEFKQADVVFVGMVASVSQGTNDVLARFAVKDVYKGTVPGNAGVHTARDVAACGVSFVPGTRYAVFATVAAGAYQANLCGGTTEDVRALERAGFHPGSPAAPLAATTPAVSHPVQRAGPLVGAALLIAVVIGGVLLYRRTRSGGAPPAPQ